jgi:hypothetical protein
MAIEELNRKFQIGGKSEKPENGDWKKRLAK